MLSVMDKRIKVLIEDTVSDSKHGLRKSLNFPPHTRFKAYTRGVQGGSG